ncbi:restriction endonuclease-like protein [Cytobacillus spongiae]|uniref:restriction endonuclease-like protein n=1 Tax=Cytobacillus spongiae TaxID=2901381 RepID=UPI001F1B4D10|nr:restriction endonuclease-like protein [Cytobacillus spongiae]UII57884.1 restriction endonuclease-like protein [Cytobacillus spongiae]
MALLPSGSREDVELVKINTDDFTLIIKGKAYHERYEGLQQYRQMDFHDVMTFAVDYDGNYDVSVFDIEQQSLIQDTQVRPIFFENGVYQIIVSPKTNLNLSFYHEHPGLRQAVSRVELPSAYILMGNLQFQNEVGLTTFEIHSEHQKRLQVTLEIFPTKLDYKNDYKKLLEEVNDEIYNLAFHFIRKTYLGAKIKLDGKPSKSEFYRLIRKHFDHFLQALSRIEHQPHHLLEKTYEKARGGQLRKLDSTNRSYLRKRAQLFVEVDRGIPIQGKRYMPIEGQRIKKQLTYDTLENRYVKWMIERLIHKLDDMLATLLNSKSRWDKEVDPDLIEKISEMKRKLEGKLKSIFWKEIQKLDRSVMSLVLQMAPGYREAFQIFLTVSKGLMLQGKFYQMSVKDVATLYEYWTFLKLGQILDRKYELVSQDLIIVKRDGLFVNLQTNQSAKRIYLHPVTKEKIELAYQKYEGNLPTIPQKPDTMLSIAKKGRDYSFNYVFDAKYRIDYAIEGSYYKNHYKTAGPMEEDINTMHRYRDSIVVSKNGSYERSAFGAYVLFPGSDEEIYREHPFYKSIDRVNIGGLPFLPNATNLVEQFVERLIEKSPEELQEEGILPRGTVEGWQSSLDEKVLVGLVATSEDYQTFSKKGYYQIALSTLKSGWQEAKYIALYAKIGVATEHGVLKYGKVSEVTFAGDNVQFSVSHWIKLDAIHPVHYGIAGSVMTTLNALKEAKELPELFMKSTDEMIIWRMLRRVSDRVKLALDHPELDQANRVIEYRIKDVKVSIDRNRRELHFKNSNVEKIVELDLLIKQPSSVFKVLIEMIS